MTPVTSAAEWDARQKELVRCRNKAVRDRDLAMIRAHALVGEIAAHDAQLAALGERPEDLDAMRAELTELRAWVAARKSARRPVKQDCAVLKGFIKGLEAKVVEAESELTELRAFKAACEGAKPVGWVNESDGVLGGYLYDNEEDAIGIVGAARPLYKHPAPVVAVTDAEILEALRAGWRWAHEKSAGRDICKEQAKRIRALLTRTQEAR